LQSGLVELLLEFFEAGVVIVGDIEIDNCSGEATKGDDDEESHCVHSGRLR